MRNIGQRISALYNASAMVAAQNHSLRRLLLTHEIAFLLLVAVAGAVGGASAYFWRQSSAESIRLNELAHDAQEIRSDAFRQLNETALARLREDPNADAIYGDYTKAVKERFNRLRQQSTSKDEGYAIQDLQERYGLLREEMNRIFGDTALLNRVVRSRLIDPAYLANITSDFEIAFNNFRGLINQKLDEQQQRIAKWSKLAPYIIPVPLIFALILLVVSRRSLTKDFVRPIRRIVAGMRGFGEQQQVSLLQEEGVAEIHTLAVGINTMNQQLLSSRDALIEKERQAALGGLVPVVAHNIRNPLASIRATVQVLDHADSEADVEQTKREIIETVDRLGRWVSALVSYLHPLTPQNRSYSASSLLDTTVGLLKDRVAAKQLKVERHPWDEELFVEVDPDLMEQAFYALMSNAIDASPDKATLGLGVEQVDDDIHFTITDAGGGIPFQPEPTELEPGPTTKRMGTGLGIPIAFKVCKAHRWELKFKINPGVGTTATIIATNEQTPES